MKIKNCKHNSFWEIYKVINFNKTFSAKNWVEFKCNNCNKKCIVKWKWYKKIMQNNVKRVFTYFLWLLPAIILIVLVANWNMNYLIAIWLITIFHFVSMIYIINSDRLKITKK